MDYFIIKRIRRMEKYFDEVSAAVNASSEKICDKSIIKKARILKKYQSSGLWLKDFERDERGELPKDLKRGVLSEDGLYNLLNEIKQI